MACNSCNGKGRWYYGSGIGPGEVVVNGTLTAVSVQAGSGPAALTIGLGETIAIPEGAAFGLDGTVFDGSECVSKRIVIRNYNDEEPDVPLVWFVSWVE